MTQQFHSSLRKMSAYLDEESTQEKIICTGEALYTSDRSGFIHTGSKRETTRIFDNR